MHSVASRRQQPNDNRPQSPLNVPRPGIVFEPSKKRAKILGEQRRCDDEDAGVAPVIRPGLTRFPQYAFKDQKSEGVGGA